MNDLVNLAMHRAANNFSGGGRMFNAANFGIMLSNLAGITGAIDGDIVSAILCGRSDVIRCSGGAHYKIVEVNDE